MRKIRNLIFFTFTFLISTPMVLEAAKIPKAEFDAKVAAMNDKIAGLKAKIEVLKIADKPSEDQLKNRYKCEADLTYEEKERDNFIKYADDFADAEKHRETSQIRAEGDAADLREKLKAYFEPSTLLKAGAFLSLTGGSLFLMYFMSKFVTNYLEKHMGKPKLVRETSMHSKSMWYMIKQTFGFEQAVTPDKLYTFDNIILPPDLFKSLKSFADETKTSYENDLPYQNLLLYGPPGTGKSLSAKTIAYYANIDYAIVKAPDFFQFEDGKDIIEFNKLIDWAEQSERGMVIFFDEADAAFGKRKQGNDRADRLVDALLSRIEKGHKKVVLIFATNHPQDLDPAIKDRIHEPIHVPLPGESERFRMLKLYIKQYLKEDVRQILIDGKRQECGLNVSRKITDDYLKDLATQLDGFSGREIEQLVDKVRTKAYSSPHKNVTPEIFSVITKYKIQQHKCKHNEDVKLDYLDSDKLNELGMILEDQNPSAAPAA